MAMERITTHVIHGSDGDENYVNAGARKCAACGIVKPVRRFYYKTTNRETTVDCRDCIAAKKAEREKARKQKVQ